MPLIKKLIQIDDSTAIVLDPAILRGTGIKSDSEVEVAVEDGAIVIRPHRPASDDDIRAASNKVLRSRRRLLERLSK